MKLTPATSLGEHDSSPDGHYFTIMALCLAGLAAIFASAFLLPHDDFSFYIEEGGPVQVFSAAAYLTVVVVLWREAGSAFVLRHAYFVLIPIAMCLRELDFQSHFTAISITKSTFYISPDIPLAQKALAVAVFAVLIWAGVAMVLRHWRDFVTDLRVGGAYAVALAVAAFLAVASKAVDGPGRTLASFGISISAEAEAATVVLEETMELGIPLFFLVAVFAWLSRRESAAAGPRRA